MTAMPADLEIDRLMNLIRGFGWEIDEKKITDTELTVTVVKKIT